MKKFLCFLVLFFLVLAGSQLTWAENQQTDDGKLGILMYQNHKKIIIAGFAGRTKAIETGIPIGGEIISINGINVKNMALPNVMGLLRGTPGEEVNLLVKYNSKTRNYTLKYYKKSEILTYESEFYKYWGQVHKSLAEPVIIDSEVAKKLGKGAANFIFANNYWSQRRYQFASGYKLCKEKPKKNQEECLTNLVKNANEQTRYDIAQDNYQRQMQQQEAYQRRKEASENYYRSMQLYNQSMQNYNQTQTNNNLNNINNSLQNINWTMKGY